MFEDPTILTDGTTGSDRERQNCVMSGTGRIGMGLFPASTCVVMDRNFAARV